MYNLEQQLKHECDQQPLWDLSWAPGGVCLICFTSGTTGQPKGVALSHSNLVFQAMAKASKVGLGGGFERKREVLLQMAPLFHIGGLSSPLTVLLRKGAQVFLPKYSPSNALTLIKKHGVTAFVAVPTMFQEMVQLALPSRFQTVVRVLIGAGGCDDDILQQGNTVFPNAVLWGAYGMTEAASSITFYKISPHAKSNIAGRACVGDPPIGIQVGLRPALDGKGMQIVTRGAHVMMGYWGRKQETDKAFLDGWLQTGDLGELDQNGQLWIMGRLKDIIRSGGETVVATEVESVLRSHSKVQEVCVVGVPDQRLGEKVAALARVTGADVDSQQFKFYCREKGLSSFKIPSIIATTNVALPRNSMGKIVKKDVQNLIVQGVGFQSKL
eukprot:TRINITY_DN14119_c1_g1_i2.p1 TRINITY_DN14119_c1_g1~~TRINITY_DN14119_c1_g1_i2.p1  ORF type:complete len:414 (+),score=57.96 TRINITY_DN14119_c1_g1_i2:92-1243(+)